MILKALTLSDMKQISIWRNQQREILRTSFILTEEMQEQFYKDIICNRESNARYLGIYDNYDLIGMCGLENIQRENRLAEISLILDPDYQDQATKALNLLLREGFMNMGLENIFTEVYDCSPYQDFWINEYISYMDDKIPMITLPNRKYWNGKYYDSLYINFNKEQYFEKKSSPS